MNIKKSLLAGMTALIICSCGNVDNIAYMQDLKANYETVVDNQLIIRAQPMDKLSIVVNSKDPLLADLFNLPIVAHRVGYEQSSSLNTSQQVSCYTVDSHGEIDFPVIGKVRVGGLTREEIAETIKGILISQDQVKDPVVTVEFANHYVSVLGEVARQGRYALDRDRVSVLEVIAMAGDLTIYGKRENIKVIRQEGDMRKVYEVDLTKGMKIMQSPVYYMKQGDVIYVEPNETRAYQSTLNGNTVRSTSFWISVGSLLTSITSVIVVLLR